MIKLVQLGDIKGDSATKNCLMPPRAFFEDVLNETSLRFATFSSADEFRQFHPELNPRLRYDKISEYYWTKIFNDSPANEKYKQTILFPVHNEEAALPTFSYALDFAMLPLATHTQYVFVTNNCSDKSPEIVKDILQRYGETQDLKRLNIDHLGDSGISDAYFVSVNNSKRIWINTSTGSKVNAMRIANRIAANSGHRIVINNDVNNWVAPNAFIEMLASCYENMLGNGEKVAVIGAQLITDMQRPGKLYKAWYQKTYRKLGEVQQTPGRIPGCLIAWDTEKIKEGHFKNSLIEDYCLGALSRCFYGATAVIKSCKARIHVYTPDNLYDYMKIYSRESHGACQLLDIFREEPTMLEFIKEDFTPLKSFTQRRSNELKKIKENPKEIFIWASRILVCEATKLIGYFCNKINPNKSTWGSVGSTKVNKE